LFEVWSLKTWKGHLLFLASDLEEDDVRVRIMLLYVANSGFKTGQSRFDCDFCE
jgi:hypothetical protein